MQAGKNAMASVKETAANIGASAKSGMEKTKATIQEKVEKMTAHSEVEKEEAERKKQERIREAETEKLEAKEQNAVAREQVRAGHGHSDDHRLSSAAPPPGSDHVEPGVASSRPLGLETGTGTAHNARVASDHPELHGAGGGYT
ncbi:hypothetical protein DsansV1_C46g0242171 [Dioscorea sansibarensis]